MIKLKDLLSERYGGAAQERSIWYHGTSAKRVKKILMRGLSPDIPKKERSWDKDQSNVARPTLESYGGIYVSRNFMTAYSSAGRTARKDNTIRAVVIMELQPRSLIADEDDFSSRLSSIAGHLCGSVYHHIYPYMWEVYGAANEDQKKWANEQKEKWCREKLESIIYGTKVDPRFKSRIYDILYSQVYKAMLTRIVSYINMGNSEKYEWVKAFRDATGQYDKKEEDVSAPNPPTQNEGEKEYMKAIDQVTRTMKHGFRHFFKGEFRIANTARSLEPIGFVGSNRITCVLEFPVSKTVNYSEDIHVLYGNPPPEFVESWERTIGDVRFV